MREDELRNRRDRGPEILVAARRLVLSIVHNMDDKLSLRRRFLRAAQVPEYCLKLIGNAAKLAECWKLVTERGAPLRSISCRA